MGFCATPLTLNQALYVMAEFHDRKDFRMEVLCHLLLRCIRPHDCLKTLTVRSLYHSDGTPRDRIIFKEHKTKKDRSVPIDGPLFKASLEAYWPSVKKGFPNGHLFLANRQKTCLQSGGVKFLLQEFVGKRGIEQCSAYSFRKCGARTMWKNGSPIESIAHVLNHHSPHVTETYIQITPKDVEDAMKCLCI